MTASLVLSYVAHAASMTADALRFALFSGWIVNRYGSVREDLWAHSDRLLEFGALAQLVVVVPAAILFAGWLWPARRVSVSMAGRHRLVAAWCVAFLTYLVGTNVVAWVDFGRWTFDDLRNQALAHLGFTMLGIAAAVLAMLVVRRVTAVLDPKAALIG